jgi:hypothetical protein
MHLRRPAMNDSVSDEIFLRGTGADMTTTSEPQARVSEDAQGIAAQKRLALNYLSEAWSEAVAEGVAPEILAHVALFTAFADLVATYGEEAVAELARSLPSRIEALEFSLARAVQ